MLFVIAAALLGLPAAAIAAPSLHDVVDECRDGGAPERSCRSLEAIDWGAAAGCRKTVAPALCEPVDGRSITPAEIAAYQSSDTHKALAGQRALDEDLPLREAQIVHTHNTFNSSSYFSTLTNQDPNQVYGITDQLDMDVRFLELDLHWVPSPFGTVATNGHWVTLCHGNSAIVPGVHIGCTWDRPFQDGLAEVRTWLDAHPGEFVFLYLENQLGGGTQAHTVAAQLLDAAFPGSMIYKPPAATPCADMPLSTSRADMKAAGARVLLVGNCGAGDGLGTPWGEVVHSRGGAWDESGSAPYDAAECTADRTAKLGGSTFRRYFGDSTWLTAMNSGSTDIGPADAAEMVRCGVNIVGFDQLMPDDGKLAAMVWSWRTAPPTSSTDCAAQAADGRFDAKPCTDVLRFACLTSAGAWAISTTTGTESAGATACAADYPGSTYGVPGNGWRNDLLRAAHALVTTDHIWLNHP